MMKEPSRKIPLEVAQRILQNQNDILKLWQEKCRERVEAAKAQTRIALLDSMPQFLDQLVQTMLSLYPELEAVTNAEVAREHAKDRSNQPEYTLDQVSIEYHILRGVIIEAIESSGEVDQQARRVIHDFIDTGIAKSAVHYIEIEKYKQNIYTVEMQTTRDEAERASQAKSSFLANMSHEIRSPLGAIMGFVGLLRDSGLTPEEISKYLSVIDRNSNHLLRIIDDILDLTKVEAGKMVVEKMEFSLIEFLADFSSMAGIRSRENGIIFQLKSDSQIPEKVITDPTRVRQILSNVVGNAIKFTENGRVELLVSYKNNALQFVVTDTGRGISEEQRNHLFQAFAQADSSTTRKFGGTGLGLILTKKLSQALGGHFELVESQIGKGSIFEVVIPVSVTEKVELKSVESLKSITPTSYSPEVKAVNLKGFDVLLVEDSPDNQYLIDKILNKTGAQLTIADNGAIGVKEALARKFDVILMDIQMPVMDGHEAVKTLRSKGYVGPIVALTAHAMKEERDRAIQSGFSHFLTKPIHRNNLTELLEGLHRPLNINI
ncbi:MAG: ATP-binding protein [Pseudobdellovibrionaceae bacterium]